MTKHIVVTDDVHEKLNILKGVLVKKNINEVILTLFECRQYNDAFFERIREKVVE